LLDDSPWPKSPAPGWRNVRLKTTVGYLQNGLWGEEPDGQNDIVCIRVADFDRNRRRVSIGNLTVRSISPSKIGRRLLRPGDLLIEKSGGGENQPVGTVVLFEHDLRAVTSNFVARLEVDPDYSASFLCYLHLALYALGVPSRSIKQSTGIQNLDADSYFNERAWIPDVPVQNAIAGFLDRKTAAIDALIAKKERLIELLQEKRQALITQAVTKGLDPTVPMKDSGVEWLGTIPAHWILRRLKHLGQIRSGIAKGRDLVGKATIARPYLRVANVQNGWLNLDDIASIDVTTEEAHRYKLQAGDVLMNEGGDFDKLGRGYVWEAQIPGCIHQNHVFAVRPSPRVNPYWVNLATQASYLRHFFVLRSKQSTNLASISATNLGEAPVPIPPAGEMEELLRLLGQRLERLDGLHTLVTNQIHLFREYRQALITAAVTGHIDVSAETSEAA
jgi:type I restriction enzyme S subunit